MDGWRISAIYHIAKGALAHAPSAVIVVGGRVIGRASSRLDPILLAGIFVSQPGTVEVDLGLLLVPTSVVVPALLNLADLVAILS